MGHCRHLDEGDGMTAFTVWKFDAPDGAERAASMLKSAESGADQGSRPRGGLVAGRRLAAEHAAGARGDVAGDGVGRILGASVGALFFVPWWAGGGSRHRRHQQGDGGGRHHQEQLETIRTEVTEGTSALFAVTDEGDLDRVGERFRGMHSTLVATNLTDAERRVLLETFGH